MPPRLPGGRDQQGPYRGSWDCEKTIVSAGDSLLSISAGSGSGWKGHLLGVGGGGGVITRHEDRALRVDFDPRPACLYDSEKPDVSPLLCSQNQPEIAGNQRQKGGNQVNRLWEGCAWKGLLVLW